LTLTTRQCLNRRIDNLDTLRKELSAWELEKLDEREKVYKITSLIS
jgi:hypothetical protein